MNHTGSPGRKFGDLKSRVFVLFLLVFIVLMNFSYAVRTDYNHDEDQFIASARLLLDQGLLPYRDYPYFHTPYLVFIYAGLFRLANSYNLLAARALSAVAASVTAILLWILTYDFFRAGARRENSRMVALTVATGVVFLYLPNPLLASAAGLSWNHAVAECLLLLAVCAVLFGPRQKFEIGWLFASGVCLGLAIGVRLSILTATPAFFLALVFYPGERTWKRFGRLCLSFGAGMALAMLPMLLIFLLAPEQFVFGNWHYARLNAIYRLDIPVLYDRGIPIYGPASLSEKIVYVVEQVIAQPVNLLMLVLFIFFGWSVNAAALSRRLQRPFEIVFVLALSPFVGIGPFLPTPSWYQYFYAPLPFVILSVALGLAHLTRQGKELAKWMLILFMQVVLLTGLFRGEEFRRLSFLGYPQLWKPVVIHRIGVQVESLIGPGGQVFTLAPLYPLEAGLKIYPPFVTGVFAYRTGKFLTPEQRQRYGVIASQDLAAFLEANPPDGILTGFDPLLEEEIVAYAMERGFVRTELTPLFSLWRSSADAQP